MIMFQQMVGSISGKPLNHLNVFEGDQDDHVFSPKRLIRAGHLI